jgi:uncharacterized RDD family membrane protein YckC
MEGDAPMTAFGGALTDPTKVTGSRIGAYLVDSVIALAVAFLLIVTVAPSWTTIDAAGVSATICDQIQGQPTPGGESIEPVQTCILWGDTLYLLTEAETQSFQRTLTLGGIGFGLLNLVLLPAITGGSMGKLLFGLRVVTANGQRAGIGRQLVRYLVLFVDSFCCGIVGLVTMRSSRGHRRLGDMAAGTFVIHRSWEGRVLQIPGLIVARSAHEFGAFGPAPAAPEPTLGQGGGVDAPVWDPSRNAYVRYDQTSGVWFQWDDAQQAWVPAQT